MQNPAHAVNVSLGTPIYNELSRRGTVCRPRFARRYYRSLKFNRREEIEPGSDFVASEILSCGGVICQRGRAARALHSERFKWVELAANGADPKRVLAAWDRAGSDSEGGVALVGY